MNRSKRLTGAARLRPGRIQWRFPLAAALLYIGLWQLVSFAFLAHRFPAPFVAGAAFWQRYAGVTGGPVEYAANLFSQTYSRQWAGALAFTLLALAAWVIARGILRRFAPGSSGSWDWPATALPAIVLILASRSLSVLYVLPMIAGLGAAWLYMALRERLRHRWAEPAVVALFLIASVPLYHALASGCLYLCVMCALFEGLVRRRPAWCLAWILCGAATPYGVSYLFYEPDLAGRYLRWIRMPEFDAMTNGLLAALYLFAPASAAGVFLADRLRFASRLALPVRRAAQAAGLAVLALLAARLVTQQLDKSGLFYADYLLDDGRPEEALASLAQSADSSDPARFRTFYALARTGRLLSEMFRYPQVASSDALLFRHTDWDTVPGTANWRSDVYLELGRVNESQRWTHESLAVEGETPRVLERMALVYILNGNADAARTFVRALEKVPFQTPRARQLLAALDRDDGMQADPLIARIRPLMLREDHVGTWNTEQILEQCLAANPANRTAFEYLLAHYLLTSNMEGLARLAPRLKDFYRELPTHVEEALLGFRNVAGSLPPGVDQAAIHSRTEARFQRFLDIWLRLENGPPERAWAALAPTFGETYWFFFVFGRTAAGPPPQLHAGAARGSGSPG